MVSASSVQVVICLMPKYIIEREIPGVGNLKREELHAISRNLAAY
jgi:hypothetical protein